MSNLNISLKAKKYLEKLPSKQYKQVASRIFDLLTKKEHSDIKHLSGRPGYFRIDQGEYRIIFKIEDNIVYIPIVGKRNDDSVYRDFSRM